MNKKQLYENIMTNVAKHVKKALNEYSDNNLYDPEYQTGKYDWEDNTTSEVRIRPRTKLELAEIIDQTIKAKGYNCDLNFIDTSLITDMGSLFGAAVSSRSNMPRKYEFHKFNGNISEWDVSNVTNMQQMFQYSQFTGDISKWDVSNVTNMKMMFSGSKFNGDISKWDVSSVKNFDDTFEMCGFDSDISNWDVSSAISFHGMFSCNDWFNQDISKWDVSNATNFGLMFCNAIRFNQNISNWDVSNATNMSLMFDDAKMFNQNLKKWNVDNAIDNDGFEAVFRGSGMRSQNMPDSNKWYDKDRGGYMHHSRRHYIDDDDF